MDNIAIDIPFKKSIFQKTLKDLFTDTENLIEFIKFTRANAREVLSYHQAVDRALTMHITAKDEAKHARDEYGRAAAALDNARNEVEVARVDNCVPPYEVRKAEARCASAFTRYKEQRTNIDKKDAEQLLYLEILDAERKLRDTYKNKAEFYINTLLNTFDLDNATIALDGYTVYSLVQMYNRKHYGCQYLDTISTKTIRSQFMVVLIEAILNHIGVKLDENSSEDLETLERIKQESFKLLDSFTLNQEVFDFIANYNEQE